MTTTTNPTLARSAIPGLTLALLLALAGAGSGCGYVANLAQVHFSGGGGVVVDSIVSPPVMEEGGAVAWVAGTRLGFAVPGGPATRHQLGASIIEVLDILATDTGHKVLAKSDANTLMIIDLANGAVEREEELLLEPSWFHEPRINRSGDVVAVPEAATPGIDGLYFLDAQGNDPPFECTIPPAGPHAKIEIDQAGRAIVQYSNRVSRFTPLDNCVEEVLYEDPLEPPNAFAIDDADQLYVLASGKLARIAPSGEEVILDTFYDATFWMRVNAAGDVAVASYYGSVTTYSRDGHVWEAYFPSGLFHAISSFELNSMGLVAVSEGLYTACSDCAAGPAIHAQSEASGDTRLRVATGDPLPDLPPRPYRLANQPTLLGYGPQGVVFWEPGAGIFVSPSADPVALLSTHSPASMVTALAVPAAPATLGFEYRFLSEAATLEVFLQGVKLCGFDAPVPLQDGFVQAQCPIDPARFATLPAAGTPLLRFTIDGEAQAIALDHLTLDGVVLPEGDFERTDPDTGKLVGFHGTTLPLDQVPDDPSAPVVTAGADQTVEPGATAQLAGVATSLGGATPTVAWTQVEGPPVTLSDPTAAQPTFVAPPTPTTLGFVLTASLAGKTGSDTVRVVVQAAIVDSDDDGVADGADNCPAVANSAQSNGDHDGAGDACDPCPFDALDDGDHDGTCGDVDNCPAIANSSQADHDLDHAGDACDPDVDGDGVGNGNDLCALTAAQATVLPANGCALAQLCPCAGPRGTTAAWQNHGRYVSCVTSELDAFVASGLIARADRGRHTSAAARSGCGRR